ncbi:hypothetical protein HaLaN_17959 [Haematococcus lacustris]|uniref:Uncharacterized protein n=1 Tax=Haematococcus lacustris TaxID=44745 RepID=A0A699ZF36_HAELA|nr:hypothetical protein HaLaN_17959 [Haematococcus lacustris]
MLTATSKIDIPALDGNPTTVHWLPIKVGQACSAVEADKYFKPTPATDGLLLSTSSQGQGAGQGGSQSLDYGSQGEGQHHGLQPEPAVNEQLASMQQQGSAGV